jgi:small multidrug resistance family-3 protein
VRELLILALAAVLEVGGDALVRSGMHGGRVIGLVLGAVVLFVYSLTVNTPRWDFGRLLGIYIAVFFVVSQVIAGLFYKERITAPTLVGGVLIVAGGLVMTLWKAK